MGEFTTPDTDKHAWGLNDEATIQVYNVAKIGGRDEKIPRTTHKIESLSETELKLEKWKGTFKRTS
jgi:hypothetical protein